MWTWEFEPAFKSIKELVASNSVLAHLDGNVPTLVSKDASSVAVGSVPSQLQHAEARTFAFASRALNDAEGANTFGQRETLAYIWACEHCHYSLSLSLNDTSIFALIILL